MLAGDRWDTCMMIIRGEDLQRNWWEGWWWNVKRHKRWIVQEPRPTAARPAPPLGYCAKEEVAALTRIRADLSSSSSPSLEALPPAWRDLHEGAENEHLPYSPLLPSPGGLPVWRNPTENQRAQGAHTDQPSTAETRNEQLWDGWKL